MALPSSHHLPVGRHCHVWVSPSSGGGAHDDLRRPRVSVYVASVSVLELAVKVVTLSTPRSYWGY